jgi:hypothetical protein
MLRDWINNKLRISRQKKHSQRYKENVTKGREHEMENKLYIKFKEAKKQGRAVKS